MNIKESCWDGYQQVGMKEKNGKQVPNCVPMKEATPVYKDWEENERPDYIIVRLKDGRAIKIEKKKTKGGERVYLAIRQAFNDDRYDITNAIINGMIKRLGESAYCNECGYEEVPNKTPNSMKYREMNESDCGCDEQQIREGNCDCDENIDEYDVETLEEEQSFIKFMREYNQLLSEATCPCLLEAEYQGRTVKLGKPMQGDVKKFKVYVKNDKGNVVKVNFGDPNMRIKKSNPERRKSFRARHNCDSPGPRWKARYWSCRKW